MKNWKEIAFGILSTFWLSMAPTNAHADTCNLCEQECNPCDWNFCNFDGFEVEVDFIWWKPCVDDLDFAARYTGASSDRHVKYHGLCPDWEPGVRVALKFPKFFSDWDVRGSYTYINPEDSSSISGVGNILSPPLHQSLIFPTLGYDTAQGSWNATYHEWDVLFGYNISCCPCHQFVPYFGVGGLIFDQDFDAHYSFETDTTNGVASSHWNSDFWGVGLRTGTCYNYKLSKCLSFFANAQGTLLAGDLSSKVHQHSLTELGDDAEQELWFTAKDDDCCHFIPGYHLSAGIVYTGCACGREYGVRLGYEFVKWHNIPNHRGFTGDNLTSEASHATSSSVRTLGFHGLVAGLSLSF